MQERKTRIILDTWISRIGSVIGWVFLVLWALIGVIGLAELPKARNGAEYVMPFFCLGIAGLHFLLIRSMKRTKQLVQDFRLYSSVLAQDPDKEISGIAEALNLPEEQVMSRLQTMCGRGYFSGHMNFRTKRMELNPGRGVSVERCPGCGATTSISHSGDTCRYCGVPLKKTC